MSKQTKQKHTKTTEKKSQQFSPTQTKQFKIQQTKLYEIVKEKEHQSRMTEQHQNAIINKKINSCILYYLLTECNGYSFSLSATRHISSQQFVYISEMKKGNEILFQSEEIDKGIDKEIDVSNDQSIRNEMIRKKLLHWRKNQIEKLVEILKNESGIEIEFDMSTTIPQFCHMIKRSKEIDDEMEIMKNNYLIF